jgi:hypothetical protein
MTFQWCGQAVGRKRNTNPSIPFQVDWRYLKNKVEYSNPTQ